MLDRWMNDMLAIDRRKKIMGILTDKKSVMVPELSKMFNITEETVRRDLEKLEKEGILKRTYGGAVLNENINEDIPIKIREGINIDKKRTIGEKVAEYIEDGDSIVLDSSTTALQVAKNIKLKKNITVITNSVKVILELSDVKGFKIISTGGTLRENAMSFVGHLAESTIKNYNIDKSIISCKGLNRNKGITESNEMEAEIKKSMIEVAGKVFLIADHSKFDRVSFIKMLDYEDIDIIFTDERLNYEWEQFFTSKDIEIIYC
jgi:DeoR/GlpR family transcriptional regulator of sugar metabolism